MATSLELAIAAIRSNRKEEGRQLLNLLIQENPNNEMAWLWMSSVVDTDEQRARCLYHVLAVNPDNQVARRGLQLLGIVVSDSRPVKVPRDSQPIKIPKPSAPDTEFLSTDQLDSKPVPKEQRRPFRIDPQAIVDELPFTPITKPFAERLQPTDSAETAAPSPPSVQPAKQTEQASNPSQPVPVVQTNPVSESAMTASWPSPTTGPSQPAMSQQTRPDTGPLPNPVMQQPNVTNVQPMHPATQTYYPAQANPAPQQPAPTTMPPQDTRPSQPVPITPAPQPSQPVPVHSNVTMGMPTQYVPAQGYSQPGSPVHSHTTMGMPTPAQPSGPMSGQMPYPSEPVQAIHSNTTMGMPAYYGQPQFQQPLPQNQALHSNSTMAMPVGPDPFAVSPAPLNQPGMVDYRVANPTSAPNTPQSSKAAEKSDEDEEINILAVIIFGSLSVTALGGLGMLILLTFATP